MQDAVRPNDDAFKRVYTAGYRTWFDLYERATDNVPVIHHATLAAAFPGHPYLIPELEIHMNPNSVLQATGRTIWKTAENKCDLPPLQMKTMLRLSTPRATRIIFDDSRPTVTWDQFGKPGHHIPILTLAWAYVLSSRWTEIIPGATLEYTGNCAPSYYPNGQVAALETSVRVGNTSNDALRWWKAIFAENEGWEACIKGRDVLSPWSVSVLKPAISIVTESEQPSVFDKVAVSYTVATNYILDYVNYYDVQEENHTAFAAALLLPTQRHISNCLYWKRPQFPGNDKRHHKAESDRYPPWGKNEYKLLTMSCNTTGIQSLLGSTFIEPDIPCNISGAWLQGAFAVLDTTAMQSPAILANMLMKKSPNIGFLWLGAIAMNSHNYIMKWAKSACVNVDLQAAGWTNTFISFLQRPVSISWPSNEITRADEARLMFLAQRPYQGAAPLVPFPPFGSISLKDCTLEVQSHAACAGQHGLRYAGISWDGKHGGTVFQSGNMAPWAGVEVRIDALVGELTNGYGNLDRDRECSEAVTRCMFSWLRGADGYPAAERAIREHEWIADEWSSDEESDTKHGDSRSSRGKNIGPWLLKGATTRSYTM